MTTLQRALTYTVAVLALSGLAACAAAPTPTPSQPSSPVERSGSPSAGAIDLPRLPNEVTHVHGIARDLQTGDLLLATHQGLFREVNSELVRVGPVIDLMGFTLNPEGTFYASGHPGVGVDLPQPVGLISSTDSGRTWRQESRGGQSDFHALTAGPLSVTGFDTTLRTTTDQKTWTDRDIPEPRTLAASPGSGQLVATTAAGMLSSTDDGTSWAALTPPAPALLAAWANENTLVIATTTGQLATSTDQGRTWALNPTMLGVADAMSASTTASGQVEILLVVDHKVLSTTDGGATTAVLVG